MFKELKTVRIIISPAQKMNLANDDFTAIDKPAHLAHTQILQTYIQQLSFKQAQVLWQSNDQITSLNYQRFQTMDLYENVAPALMAFDGIQYQYMAPSLLDQPALSYLQEHLRILSGFYGSLRPFDGVTPYRLELQSKVDFIHNGTRFTKLYPFWQKLIYQHVTDQNDDGLIVNLASKEYSKAIIPYLEESDRLLTCTFASIDPVTKQLKIKATEAKIARGEMVRFMAENQITDGEDLKQFDSRGFHFHPARSSSNEFIFTKE